MKKGGLESRDSELVLTIQSASREKDSTNKKLFVELLTKLALSPFHNSKLVLEFLSRELEETFSPNYSSLLFSSASKIVSCKRIENSLLCKMEERMNANLSHSQLVSTCLQVESRMCEEEQMEKVEQMLSHFGVNSNDGRVRKSAFECLLTLYERGKSPSLSVYSFGVRGLEDDYEEVRIVALHLIWMIGRFGCEKDSIPENPKILARGNEFGVEASVDIVGGERRKEIGEDAFIKICKCVTDGSVQVRRKACSLLGRFPFVSTQLLLQTFNKKLIQAKEEEEEEKKKGERKGGKKGEKEKKRNQILSFYNPNFAVKQHEIEWKVQISLEDVRCVGAFVHGLEDEFAKVRIAAVDSICELSLRSTLFAKKAVDFLVDMFNDEIESVRVASVGNLRKLGGQVQLSEEQLHTVLFLLEDSSEKVRREVHSLLAHIRQSNATCFHRTIVQLLESARRNLQDENSVFSALIKIGELHSDFTQLILDDILQIDQRFMQAEKHVNDSFCWFLS